MILHYSETSRPALGPTQRPVQWVFGALSSVLRSRRNADHTHVRLAERLGICEDTNSWREEEKPYLLTYSMQQSTS